MALLDVFLRISGMMNSLQKALMIIPAMMLILVSCGNRADTPSCQSVMKADTCREDESHTYIVYVPAHSSECDLMPLVIIIDPHGSGAYAISHFIQAAETYKCILGASDLVRNNYAGYNMAIESLINDMQYKYPVGNKIYLAGFSGGARMVLSFAQHHRTNGVLACGALAAKEQINAIKSNIYALSGRADFNFPEVADFILNEPEKPPNLKIQLTGEMHQWPSPEDLSHALGWLYLNDRPSDTRCIRQSVILREFAGKGKELADSFLRNDQYIQTKMICQNMLEIKDLPDRRIFEEMIETAGNNPALFEEISQLRKSLQFEYRIREAYYSAIGSKDMVWWNREINDLNSRLEAGKDLTMHFALMRIKAFLGIVCYSLANNALRTDDLNTAAKILEIYQLVEPANPDMFYFFALYYLNTGDKGLVSESIRNALENGFSDTVKIKREFPVDVWKTILSDD